MTSSVAAVSFGWTEGWLVAAAALAILERSVIHPTGPGQHLARLMLDTSALILVARAAGALVSMSHVSVPIHRQRSINSKASDRKRAELKAGSMRRPCEVIADLVSDAVLVVDDAGTILLANRPSELLLGGSGRQHVAHLAGEIGLFAPAQLLQLGDRSGPPSLGEVASLREEQERIVGAHVTRQS